MLDIIQKKQGHSITIVRSRNDKLTKLALSKLQDDCLLQGEDPQDRFAKVAGHFADDSAHAQRIYDYMSQLWFMPATPILTYGGTTRGMPVSCFLNEAQDSLEDIVSLWNETVWLASNGGGIGSYWGNIRSVGERVRRNGQTSGIIPFIRVMDSLTQAVSPDSKSQGSATIYLDIDHPEIEEFIDIRNLAQGDQNRKAPNLHHGVLITNGFMQAVADDKDWPLKSPKDRHIVAKVRARDLWDRLLNARTQTGQPYIIYKDHVNDQMPDHHKMAGLSIKTSNLCSEITLPTGRDHLGNDRTAVCCLSSLNFETYDAWKDHPSFIEDIMRFLDNVLSDFIKKAPDSMRRAKYAAMRERSVGLGVMGFHAHLQSKMIPLDSAMAKVWNRKIFQQIKTQADTASRVLAEERGACPDAADYGIMERFSNKIAVAPTISTSVICGETSPSIEPFTTNGHRYQTSAGAFETRNKHLEELLRQKDQNSDAVWSSIFAQGGSVQHLDMLSQDEKDVFKTAYEIDARWIIEHAADRAPYICQSQSLNLFLPRDTQIEDMHDLHWTAWEKGVKTLYVCHANSQMSDQETKEEDGEGQRDTSGALLTKRHQQQKLNEQPEFEDCLECRLEI